MKVGILTLPYEPNYGWAVQLWALYTSIEKLGHNPVVINRRWNTSQKGLLYKTKRFLYYKGICRRFSRFLDNEIINITREIRNNDSMTKLAAELDAVVVGSDQVWRIENTRGANLNFFLDFIPDNSTKRISYAASFGKDTWQGSPAETEQVSKLLSKFDSITVREDSGVTLCNELFHVNAIHVVDPTLLLTKEDYNSILSKPKKKSQITTYILDSTDEKRNAIFNFSEISNVNVVPLYSPKRITYYHSVYYWLENIRDAKYVIVDSFHGMVLSIVFRKNFVVLANAQRGLTRFTSLLSQLGLEDRLTNEFTCENIMKILSNEIDYFQVESKLKRMREFSLNILKESLQK